MLTLGIVVPYDLIFRLQEKSATLKREASELDRCEEYERWSHISDETLPAIENMTLELLSDPHTTSCLDDVALARICLEAGKMLKDADLICVSSRVVKFLAPAH